MRSTTLLALATALWLPFCGAQSDDSEKAGTFEGYWVATGKRDGVPFPAGREAFVFSLQGSLNIKTNSGALSDVWATCVGLRDTTTGADARCVWENEDGERIFSEFTSSRNGDTETATGRFIGGTGRLEGIEGGYSFTWATLFFEERDERLSGFVRGIQGSWQLP